MEYSGREKERKGTALGLEERRRDLGYSNLGGERQRSLERREKLAAMEGERTRRNKTSRIDVTAA